jgi:AcrR family transcriptional regulator
VARPPNADGQRTRQAILDAALALFAEKGYYGTSLRDVAAAVGVRESAIYNYFPGKEALFEALLTAESAIKTGKLSEILEAPVDDARFVLEQLAEFLLDRFVLPRQQQLFRILMSDGLRLAREGRINLLERMGSARPGFEQVMKRLIDGGDLRNADPEILVMQFIGPLIFWRHLHAIGANTKAIRNRHAFARAHVDQFLNGAAVAPSRRAAADAPRRAVADAPRRLAARRTA